MSTTGPENPSSRSAAAALPPARPPPMITIGFPRDRSATQTFFTNHVHYAPCAEPRYPGEGRNARKGHRLLGCASQVDGDQAQLACVALAVVAGQPAVLRAGEHLGEPQRPAGKVRAGATELAAQDAGEDGAAEVDVHGLDLAGRQDEDPARQAEVACPAGGALRGGRSLSRRDVPG